MASPRQKKNIQALNAFWQSQQAGQQAGLPGFATIGGQTFTPAQAAAAGASPGMAAQFGPTAGPPPPPPGQAASPIAGAIQPGTPQGMNRAQKLAGLQANVAAALKAPAPGTQKTLAALATTIQQPEEERQFVVIARQLQRLIRANGRRANDAIGNLSIPGDVWFPVLVLLVLLFVIVPIPGADGKYHTRLMWLWLTLIGQAHVVGEALNKPVPASGATTSGNVPAPGAVPGQQEQLPDQNGNCRPGWHKVISGLGGRITREVCVPDTATSSSTGSGTSYYSSTTSQPLYTGRATLGAEDYL